MSSQQQSSSTGFGGAQPITDHNVKPVIYNCGNCDMKIELKKGDAIRCTECGYRVLYKQRTDQVVQFQAV